jgi:predicted RNase H-like nuclease
MASTTFIGVDLAWKVDGNHSGIAVLRGNERRVRLTAISQHVLSMAAVLEFIARHAQPDCVLAIDASLVVRNQSGQRPCETLIAKTFGRHHASCHTSNLTRPYATTGMQLVAALADQGFAHDLDMATAIRRRGRWVFEVYPHPAMVRIFGLDRIIQYKKGPVADRRRGLEELRRHLAGLAGASTGWMSSFVLREVLQRDLEGLRGAGMKHHEDTLDAIFCAYLAWHCWRWGASRNEVFGSLAEGCIVVPTCGPRAATDDGHRPDR